MPLRDILETTNRGVRTTKTGARSNIEDAKIMDNLGRQTERCARSNLKNCEKHQAKCQN
jgi:hypothetical protein